jgi:hypothetical protein
VIRKQILAIAVGACLAAGPAAAQQPRTVNARVVPRSAGADLQQAFSALLKEQAEAAWVGYTVPAATNGDGTLSNDGWSERCRLEQTNTPPAGLVNSPGAAGPVRLEPSGAVMVLFRVQNHEVQKIRTFSTDCQIDAGGLMLVWLDPVAPSQSVALLRAFAADPLDKTRSEPALSAMALHKDAAATAALFELASSGIPRMRQRALFWIARRAETRAAATITAAIANDPDVEVKKQAVFALSQLPRGEGVPLLIDLARKNANPIVRKQAYFWLGQSTDPRALAFFEEVLR